jgi:hypothetical protein
LIRAVYVGQDYSDRWGNYFAHALVLDDIGEGRWPIDAFPWAGWVSKLVDDDNSDPVPLPEVDVDELTTRADFSFDELATFLNESDDRRDVLEMMLRAVFRRRVDSRSIVVREQIELNGLYWVACIQKAFPAFCQKDLSCSTFQFDPRSSFAVNATFGETDFLFDEGERKYQFYVFDFETGTHSPVPSDGAEYSRAVAAWMATDPERLRAFHEFASLFKELEIDGRLLHVLKLYQIELGLTAALGSAELRSILEFVREHARPAAFSRLLRSVEHLTKAIQTDGRPEDWAAVVRFLADGASVTGEDEHRLRACQTWLAAFDMLVIARHTPEEMVLGLRTELEKTLPNGARMMSDLFLRDAHVDWIIERASKLSQRTLAIVMNEIDRSFHQTNQTPTHSSQAARNLIEAVVAASPQPPDLQWAFMPFRSRVEELVAVTEHIASVVAAQVQDGAWTAEQWQNAAVAIGGSLASVLATCDRSVRFTLINVLKTKDGYAPFLYGEWESAMQRASDKSAAHAEYETHVFNGNSKFVVEMPSRMALGLLRMLPADGQRIQARKWVESGRTRQLSEDVAAKILFVASMNVSLVPEDGSSDALAQLIVAECSARKLKITTTRLDLRDTARRCVNEPDGINGLRSILQSIDAESYREFVSVVLPRLLSRATTRGQHRRVVLAMALAESIDIFAERYCSLLFQRSLERVEPVDGAALAFWLKLEQADSAWPLLGSLRERALDAIAARLRAMPKKRRAKIESSLHELDDIKGDQGRKALEAFLERPTQTSWLGRLFGSRS